MLPRDRTNTRPTKRREKQLNSQANPKVALITGVTGQDGAYLAEFLLKKGYIVHGIKRRSSLFNTARIDKLYQDPHVEHRNFILHYGDLTDSTNLIRIIQQVQPDEIYNLAAQSHVAVSFEEPEYTANADGLGALRILEAIRILGLTEEVALLPGLDVRAVRPGPGDSAEGDDAVLSAQSVRGREAVRVLDHRQLPRGVRDVRLQRRALQPREPASRRDLRDAQDHARRLAHRAGSAGLPVPRQHERASRLGPCPRLHRDAVADAATGDCRRLRHRHRRAIQRAAVRASSPPRNSASASVSRAPMRRRSASSHR